MKIRQYFFGYLFVRFAKLIALLALLIMAADLFYVAAKYQGEAAEAAYRPSNSLRMELRALREEFGFAREEVSRLAGVSDLVAPDWPEMPERSVEFERLLQQLSLADARRLELKTRLTAAFDAKATALRERIEQAVREIEQMRAAAQPARAPRASAVPAPSAPQPAPAPQPGRWRTVFESDSPPAIRGMHGTLADARRFLDELEKSAEKEESKRLIGDARAALNDLDRWLPEEPAVAAASTANFPAPARSVAPSAQEEPQPPPDPLTTAIRNYEAIGRMMDSVHRQLHNDWRLDRTTVQAMRTAENEAASCRAAEARLRQLLLARAAEAGWALLIGIAVAFAILVFADFIQSFFDTATNSAAIRERLERRGGP